MEFCFGLKSPVKGYQERATANCFKDLPFRASVFRRFGFLDNRGFFQHLHSKQTAIAMSASFPHQKHLSISYITKQEYIIVRSSAVTLEAEEVKNDLQ